MYHRNKRATNSVHMNMMRYSNMRGNSKAKLPYIGNGFVTVVKRDWRYFAVAKTQRLFIRDIFRVLRIRCVTDPKRYVPLLFSSQYNTIETLLLPAYLGCTTLLATNQHSSSKISVRYTSQ
jgi:hypothetical protein